MASDKEIRQISAGFQNQINLQNYEAAMERYYADLQQDEINRKYKDDIAKQQYIYQNEQIQQANQAQLDAFEKSQKTYENNLKAIDFYAKNQEDRITLGLDEKIAEIGFASDQLNLAFEKQVIDAAFGSAEAQQQIDSARGLQTAEIGKIDSESSVMDQQKLQIGDQLNIKNAEDKKVQYSQFSIDKQVENIKTDQSIKDKEKRNQQRTTQQFASDQAKAQNEKNYAYIQASIDQIKATGSARARGQKGASASKQIDALAATVSFNMSKLTDDLFFSKSALERQKQSSLETESIIDDAKTKLSRDIDVQGFQRSSLTEDRNILGFERDRLGRDRQQLTIRQDALQLDKNIVNIRSDDTVNTAQRNKDKIADMLGVAQEELDLDQDKLAEQLLSEAEASKIALQEVETKELEAKNKAYEAQMLAPKLQPLLPEPYKTPETIYLEPQEPIKFPQQAAGQGVGNNIGQTPPSTVSSVLGIASGIAAVAAPFTGGLAAPISAGLGFLSNIFK